jgi:hypothetical protein
MGIQQCNQQQWELELDWHVVPTPPASWVQLTLMWWSHLCSIHMHIGPSTTWNAPPIKLNTKYHVSIRTPFMP